MQVVVLVVVVVVGRLGVSDPYQDLLVDLSFKMDCVQSLPK